MVHLRHRLAAGLPEEWDKTVNNGPFTYVSPLIVSTRNHEEGVYAIKVRQILRHGFPYDPHTGDRSLRSWIFDCMLFYPLAPFAWIAGGDIQKGWILAHASLAVLWTLFFFGLFRRCGAEHEYSLLFATAAFFFLDVFMWPFLNIMTALPVPRDLATRLFFLPARATGPVQFMRLPTPGMTFLWLYGALAASVLLAAAPRRRAAAAVLTGILVASLCLAHFYEWTFGVACLAFLLAAAMFFEPPGPWRWNLAAANAVSLAISAAYYLFASRMTSGVMGDIIYRMGTPGERYFVPSSPAYLVLAYVFWRHSRRFSGAARWIWLSAAVQEAACFPLLNLSLLLGYNMQFDHYHMMGSFTSAVFCLCWLAESKPLKRALKPHAAVLVAAIFAWVALREKSWADTHYRLFGTPRDVASAAEWMNGHVPPGSTLLALSGALTEFLPQRLDMTWAVANGSPSYGSPIPTARNLEGIARIVKTVGADPDRFLSERWANFPTLDARKQLRTYLTRNLAWEETDREAWPYFLLNIRAWRLTPGGWEEGEFRRYYRQSPPIPRPFYLWLQKGDEALLTKTPEALGGGLIYENPSVRLYRFSDGPA